MQSMAWIRYEPATHASSCVAVDTPRGGVNASQRGSGQVCYKRPFMDISV